MKNEVVRQDSPAQAPSQDLLPACAGRRQGRVPAHLHELAGGGAQRAGSAKQADDHAGVVPHVGQHLRGGQPLCSEQTLFVAKTR